MQVNQYELTPTSIASALPDFMSAGTILILWVNPFYFGNFTMNDLIVIMVMEFITMHASAFLLYDSFSTFPIYLRIFKQLFLSVFYLPFAAAAAIMVHAWWPVITFIFFFGKRIYATLLNLNQLPDTEEIRQQITRAWVAQALCFFGTFIIATYLPMPHFGITPEVAMQIRTPIPNGLWHNDPQTGFAFLFLYFTAIACSACFNNRWLAGFKFHR